MEWHQEINETYPVKIRVHSHDRVGLLADLAANISKNDANILKVNTETRDNKTVDSYFTIAVESTEHLSQVLSDLKKIKLVQFVKRIS